MDFGSIEAQLSSNAAVAEQVDNFLPIEAPAKPNGVFASDCCGSNNYAK
jgi:hypothetical protein